MLDGGPGSDRSFAATDDTLIFSLGGLSKSVGLPQLKLAWVVLSGPTRAVHRAAERLDYIADAFLSPATPTARALPELLESAAPVHRAIADRCRTNLETLGSLVSAEPAVDVARVGGGWSAIVRVPAILDDEQLAVRLLTELGVAVHPGYLFDLPREGMLVLSLLTPEETWRGGLRRLFDSIRDWI